jgi:hypothetical protein
MKSEFLAVDYKFFSGLLQAICAPVCKLLVFGHKLLVFGNKLLRSVFCVFTVIGA